MGTQKPGWSAKHKLELCTAIAPPLQACKHYGLSKMLGDTEASPKHWDDWKVTSQESMPTTLWKKHTEIDGGQGMGWGAVKGKGELWGDGNILHIDCEGGIRTVYADQHSVLHTWRVAVFMVCVNYSSVTLS
jgi:hypothetical protein